MKGLIIYFKRIYRLLLNAKKQEDAVWKDLKTLHANKKWRSGIYENDRYIETPFEIANQKGASFYYMIYDGHLHCRVKVLDFFTPELTTEVFILASHFNNLLNNGTVTINVDTQHIEYHQKQDLLIPLLYTGEAYALIMRHYNTSKDIYWAFHRLVEENEAPAIIIADLLKKVEEEKGR